MTTCKSANPHLQQRARVLLSAWDSGDRVHLEAALSPAAKVSFKERDSSYAERSEMVEVAEEAIRVWLWNPTPEAYLDLQVSLRLLKHLAGCEAASAVA